MAKGGKSSGYKRKSDETNEQSNTNSRSTPTITVNGMTIAQTKISEQSALLGTNPNYGKVGPDGNVDAYTNNCTKCSFAYEMRRRGFNVEATEFTSWDDRVVQQFERAFVGMKYESIGASRKSQVVGKVKEKMESWGNGSRAIMYVQWRNGYGHVFNMELTSSGELRSHDGQTGLDGVLERYAQRSMPTKARIARVDPLEPNRMYLNGAIKKGSNR